MARTAQPQMMTFTVNIPSEDFKKFKSFFKAMGWVFEEIKSYENS